MLNNDCKGFPLDGMTYRVVISAVNAERVKLRINDALKRSDRLTA